MSWIEGSGSPDLPAIFQVLSIDPDALEIVKDLNETISFGNSALGRVREEAIATVVAVANRCRFGALTHSGFLRQHSADPETTSKMLVNYNTAKLGPADRTMLDFAVRATTKPSSLTRHDVAKLRRAGFDDHEVLSIVLITCLVNFMNRLADCLGVDVRAGYEKAMGKWLTAVAAHQPWLMKPLDQKGKEVRDGQAPTQSTGGTFLDQKDSAPPSGPNGYGEPETNGLGSVGFGEIPNGSIHNLRVRQGFPEDERSTGMAGAPPCPEPEESGESAALFQEISWETSLESSQEALLDIAQESLVAEPSSTPPEVIKDQGDGMTSGQKNQERRVSSLDPNHPVAKFVNQNCRVTGGGITGAKELYIGYLRWCDDTGAPPMLQRSFGMALTQMGFNRRRRGRNRTWAWWGLNLWDRRPTVDEDTNFHAGPPKDPPGESEFGEPGESEGNGTFP